MIYPCTIPLHVAKSRKTCYTITSGWREVFLLRHMGVSSGGMEGLARVAIVRMKRANLGNEAGVEQIGQATAPAAD